MKHLRKHFSFVFLVVLFFSFSKSMYSQSEESVRAMWIFNIASSTTWEEEQNISKYTIGVFSSEKEYEELKKLAETRPIKKKPVQFIRYEKVEDVKPNHIIFVTNEENENLSLIYNTLKGESINYFRPFKAPSI